MKKQVTLAVIVGNRGFFPAELCRDGRQEILGILKREGVRAICLTPKDTKYGAVESLQDARKCAELFARHRDEIDGILITLPNFGDEKAIANTIRFSGLNVPILVHAYPDDPKRMDLAHRRDSFCGKLSVCNNLLQYGFSFTVTDLHTVDPNSESFLGDLREFVATCRVVRGLRRARLGSIGARTGPFNTVRFSEKLLEQAGISVETVDLSEVFGWMEKLGDTDRKVKNRVQGIQKYLPTDNVPEAALNQMAKFGIVLQDWIEKNEIDGVAVQCWTAIEELIGITPCTVMSMLSESLIPAACEVDVTGLVGMYALQLASCQPSALVDWNNNFGNDPERGVIFHCSNYPKSVFTSARVSHQDILAGTVGVDRSYGTCVGRMKPGPLTFCRVATHENIGAIGAYLAEGESTEDALDTFGGYTVVHVPGLQELLRYACLNGFEHHVAVSYSSVARPVFEALRTYLGWEVYLHEG